MRFMAAPNLMQLIRREERNVDAGEVRAHLNDIVRKVFGGQTFDAKLFPGGPFDIRDDLDDGRPRLAVMSYDAVTVGASVETVPDLLVRCYERKGAEGTAFRALRNYLAFIVADEVPVNEMRRLMTRQLDLQNLKKAERLAQLAEHQRDDVLRQALGSEAAVAISVQQCYRHLFYSTKTALPPTDVSHTAIELGSASERPGAGQLQVVRALRDMSAAVVPISPPLPRYEVRLHRDKRGAPEITVWQMPSPATPHLKEPQRLGGLARRNLELVEAHVLRRLAGARFRGEYGRSEARGQQGHALDEQTALRLALMFRAVAPMRHRDRMRAVAEGVEAMGREEAAYWLGMTLHRHNPRRVLTALRYLLTESVSSNPK